MTTTLVLVLLLATIGCGEKEDTSPVTDTGGEVSDVDGDGHTDDVDCDDANASIHPDAVEICDDLDNDCDGLIDDEDDSVSDATTWYTDADGDGYGDDGSTVQACEQPSGTTEDGGDCDDGNAAVNTLADELCDGVDNDCDGDTDEDDAIDAGTWFLDSDGDGYGGLTYSTTACAAPTGFVADSTDCDEGDDAKHPGADEYCNGADDDCDGDTDEDDAVDTATWYADGDGDGYGDPTTSVTSCAAPSDHVADDTDCDDGDDSINPGSEELCNGEDDDCDGDTDEADAIDAPTWYADSDGDDYGDPLVGLNACDQPSGYVTDSTDCDDLALTVNPAADETCDGLDNDCDGDTDEDDAIDASTWFLDYDGDGYAGSGYTTTACTAPTGFMADSTDCDEGDAANNPGADEVCDGADNDCDGDTDEDSAIDAVAWFLDGDGDGYGDPAATDLSCEQPSGHVADDTDCDDSDAAVNPGAIEVPVNGIDDDCDGLTDPNTAPSISSLTLSPESVYTNDTLSASVSTSDTEGDPVTVSFAWYVDGGLVTETGASLDGATWFDKGQQVYVIATPSDGTDDGAAVTSDSVEVLNTLPTAPVVSILPLEPVAGVDDLVCMVDGSSTDADGDSVSYTMNWTVDGVAYTSGSSTDTGDTGTGWAGSFTTTWPDDSVPAGDTLAEDLWGCSATPDDGEEVGDPGTAEVDVVSGGPCHAIQFEDIDASISVDSTGFGVGTAAWTFEFWMRWDGGFTPSGNGHLIDMNEDYAAYAFRPLVILSTGAVGCYTYNDTSGSHNMSIETGDVTDGDWHHVACVYDGAGTGYGYFDGILSGTDSASPNIKATSNMAIGKTAGYAYEVAPVSLGPLRYSSAVLYSTDFTPTTAWTAGSDTIAMYLVDEGFDGTTLVDEAGGDNDGTHRSGMAAAGWCD